MYKRNWMLHHSSYIFDCTENTIGKTMQLQHLNQYINIYSHRECCKTSFIYCFIVTLEKLIWPVFFFLFSGSCWPTKQLYLSAVLLIDFNTPTISGLSPIVEIYKLSYIFEIVMNGKKNNSFEVAAKNFIIFVAYRINFGEFMKYVLSWVRPTDKVATVNL